MIIGFLFSYILGFIILFAYICYIIYKDKRIPMSISATVYSLDWKNKWIYTIVILASAFLIAPLLFEITSAIGIELLAYFTMVGMLGVGVCPLVYGEKNTLHYGCAILMGVSSQALILFNLPQVLFLWALYVPYTLIWEYSGKNMFFAEMIMIIGIMLMCILLWMTLI